MKLPDKTMKGQNMDLTKYFPQGNNLEQTKPKDTSDLINEMQSQGLQISHLEITGEIVRVPVNELAGVKADSNNQKSGYYVVNEVNGNYFATFGNWKTGFEGKWSRWFIKGDEYFRKPTSRGGSGEKGSADDYHEAIIRSALGVVDVEF